MVGLDSRPEVLAAAAIAAPAVATTDGLDARSVGDGRSLPYPDDAFDVVHASLVLHHLEPRRGRRRSCAEMARVARLGIVVNDLRPEPAGAGSARGSLGHLLTAQPLHAPRRAAVGPARVPRRRGARPASARAGLAPVRTDPRSLRASLRDRRGPAGPRSTRLGAGGLDRA